MQALGADPVTMAWAEVYTALQQGYGQQGYAAPGSEQPYPEDYPPYGEQNGEGGQS